MAAARSRARADETKAKPRSDAYVGLLGLSLLALSAAMLFAFLNWNLISEKPKAVQVAPKAGGAMPGPGGPMNPPLGPGVNPPVAPGVPPGAAPGVPPGQQPGGNPPPQKK